MTCYFRAFCILLHVHWRGREREQGGQNSSFPATEFCSTHTQVLPSAHLQAHPHPTGITEGLYCHCFSCCSPVDPCLSLAAGAELSVSLSSSSQIH